MTSDHHFLASAVDVHRQQGYQIADDGYSCDGEKNVSEGQYYGICLDNETAGHLYESEMLLQESESHAGNKSSGQTDKRYHPALKYKDAFYKAVRSPEAAQGLYVVLFLDDEH